ASARHVAEGRHHEDRNVRADLSQRRRYYFATGDFRVAVHHQCVDWVQSKQGQGFLCVRSYLHLVPTSPKFVSERVRTAGVIVNEKDRWHKKLCLMGCVKSISADFATCRYAGEHISAA